MSVLHLMRHGQASFGQETGYDKLSPLGVRQARIAGERLGRQGLHLDAAYCGTLSRQRDTAQAVLDGLKTPVPLTVLPEFNEYDSWPIMDSLLPGLRRDDPAMDAAAPSVFKDRRSFQLVYEAAMMRWISGRYDTGEFETWAAFQQRVRNGVEMVQAENLRGRTVMVFTSGGPISAVMRLALGLGDETALRLTWVIKNASLSSLLFDSKRTTLALFNSTAHLEQEGDEGLITYR